MEQHTSTGGVRLSGTAVVRAPGAWPALVAEHGTLIPPYPGPTVVPAVTVPPPPALAADESARLHQLGRAYVGAVERRYRARCWAFQRGAGRHLVVLQQCAAALAEYAVSPAAWVGFSVDVWRAAPQGATPPPIGWVFSEARVGAKADWFAEVSLRYAGGQTWLGDRHRDLLRRWSRMRADLLGRAEPDAATVARVVAGYFRDGQWDVLVERARDEALAAQRMINEEAERGAFLW